MDQTIVNLGKKIIPHNIRIFLRKVNWKRHYFIQNLFSKPNSNKVYCPIAKKEFKSFIKINHHLLTPSNGARERQRLIWHYLVHELHILDKPARILHVAPELPFLEILKRQKNLEYVAADKMVDGYSNQKGIENIDLTELKFDDASFDYVLCNHVLEHIPDDRAAISEIYRVMKMGGTGVITVPINEEFKETYEDNTITSPKERKKHFGQWDHVRWYAQDIKYRFEEVGFSVEMNRYSDNFSEAEFKKFGFCKDILIVLRKTIS